jgi:protein NRD1
MNDIAAQILQALQAGTIAPDQAMQVLGALATAQNGGMSLQTPQAAPQTQPQAHPGMPNNVQHENRTRDRSRSPDYQHRRSPDAPNRRQSPTYGVYDPNAASNGNMQGSDGDRGRGRGKRGGRNDYRQRSPPRRQQSPSRNGYGQSTFLEWDDTLPRDHIKVFSRTLFVGGAGGSEGEIRSIFSRFGRVQTCIVNQDKRHAFVKMYTRPDAIAAKEGMDATQDAATLSKARQVRAMVFLRCNNTDFGRHAGELALDLANVATMRPVSA